VPRRIVVLQHVMHGFPGVVIWLPCIHTSHTRPPAPAGCQTCLRASLRTASAPVYMHCCLAQWGIYWFPQVMHLAVRFPAYADYLVPGRVLPSVASRPLWPGIFRADSSRAHAPHRAAAPASMHETESLRRRAHVLESSRRFW